MMKNAGAASAAVATRLPRSTRAPRSEFEPAEPPAACMLSTGGAAALVVVVESVDWGVVVEAVN